MACGQRYESVGGDDRTCGDEGLVCEECFQAEAAKWSWLARVPRPTRADLDGYDLGDPKRAALLSLLDREGR